VNEALPIGTILRTARERMGLGVIQAAERMHVDAAIIEALEADRFVSLGAPVYVRGHLRRYAELLGEPAGPLQDRYAAMQESTAMPDLTRAPRMIAQQATERDWRWPLILLAGVLVLGVILWWAMQAKPAQ
jgi:cytoskeleton protein RodZ